MAAVASRSKAGSNFLRFLTSLAAGFQNFHDFFDRVPIARGCGHAEELLELAEVADRLHLTMVQAQDESALDRNDL